MKTVTLRTLIRDPLSVKRLTRRGAKVQVTDRGRPLWFISSAEEEDAAEEAANKVAIDQMLEELLAGPVSPLNLSRIVKDGRG